MQMNTKRKETSNEKENISEANTISCRIGGMRLLLTTVNHLSDIPDKSQCRKDSSKHPSVYIGWGVDVGEKKI